MIQILFHIKATSFLYPKLAKMILFFLVHFSALLNKLKWKIRSSFAVWGFDYDPAPKIKSQILYFEDLKIWIWAQTQRFGVKIDIFSISNISHIS